MRGRGLVAAVSCYMKSLHQILLENIIRISPYCCACFICYDVLSFSVLINPQHALLSFFSFLNSAASTSRCKLFYSLRRRLHILFHFAILTAYAMDEATAKATLDNIADPVLASNDGENFLEAQARQMQVMVRHQHCTPHLFPLKLTTESRTSSKPTTP